MWAEHMMAAKGSLSSLSSISLSPSRLFVHESGGATLCQPCASVPGMYCPGASPNSTGVPCPAGYRCNGSSFGPIACPVGSFSLSGATNCSACVATAGWACAGGSPNATGTPCPLGQFSLGGSASCGDCQAVPGMYCPDGTSDARGVSCSIGRYSSLIGRQQLY